jgi:hypothetical protein
MWLAGVLLALMYTRACYALMQFMCWCACALILQMRGVQYVLWRW